MGGGWTKVGKIAVDSGTCWLGDPCYFVHHNPADFGASSREFAQRQIAREERSPSGQVASFSRAEEDPQFKFLGVAVRTGFGDGIYDVEARFSRDGRVAEVRVVFIEVER